jgi:hypothetical protein
MVNCETEAFYPISSELAFALVIGLRLRDSGIRAESKSLGLSGGGRSRDLNLAHAYAILALREISGLRAVIYSRVLISTDGGVQMSWRRKATYKLEANYRSLQ